MMTFESSATVPVAVGSARPRPAARAAIADDNKLSSRLARSTSVGDVNSCTLNSDSEFSVVPTPRAYSSARPA